MSLFASPTLCIRLSSTHLTSTRDSHHLQPSGGKKIGDTRGGGPEGLDFEVRMAGKELPIAFELHGTLRARVGLEGIAAQNLWLGYHLPSVSMISLANRKSLGHPLSARVYPLCLKRVSSHQPTWTLPPKTLAMTHAILPLSIQR